MHVTLPVFFLPVVDNLSFLTLRLTEVVRIGADVTALAIDGVAFWSCFIGDIDARGASSFSVLKLVHPVSFRATGLTPTCGVVLEMHESPPIPTSVDVPTLAVA